jgi:parvulin-like peptidyl-prolyl isomerase
MGVMERFRSSSDSSGMQFVMVLVIVSFIMMFGTTRGDQTGVTAEVNGVRIMQTDYRKKYRDIQRGVEGRQQRTLSNDEQRTLGELVKESLVNQELEKQEADRLGVFVSGLQVSEAIYRDPRFRNPAGQYEPQRYKTFLKRGQYTVDEYQDQVRQELRLFKLRQLIELGASVSEPVVRQSYVDRSTRLQLSYVRIRQSQFQDDIALEDAAVSEWLEENAALVQETYDQDLENRYTHPEEVRLGMINFVVGESDTLDGLRAELATLRDELEQGADFGDLARARSDDPTGADGGDLGMRAVNQLTLDVSESVEGLEVGGLSPVLVVEGREVRLYKLLDRVAFSVDTFEEVKLAIAEQLIRDEQLPERTVKFAEDEFLESWASSGVIPETLVQERELLVQSTGMIPQMGAGDYPDEMMAAARSVEPGTVLPDVYERHGEYWVAKLETRELPDMELYEKNKESLHQRDLQERRQTFYEDWRDDAKSRATIRIR